MVNEMKYEFTVVLADVTELTIEMADTLFRSGCDDGSPASCDGRVTVDFHRQATSLEAAIRAAAHDISVAGFSVAKVELEAPELLSA